MTDPIGWIFAAVILSTLYMVCDMAAYWLPRIWRRFK